VKVIHVMPMGMHKTMPVFASLIYSFFQRSREQFSAEHDFLFQWDGDQRLISDFESRTRGFPLPRKAFFRSDFLLLLRLMRGADEIYFHQIPSVKLRLLVSLTSMFFRIRFNWIVWGGDLYQQDPLLKGGVKTSVFRAFVQRRINALFVSRLHKLCAIKDDLDTFNRLYPHAAAKQHFFNYPVDIAPDYCRSRGGRVRAQSVLISHSAAKSNNHFLALDALSKIDDKRMRVYSILSYGASPRYVCTVVERGRALFGDRFIPIVNFMDSCEYSDFLSKIDVSLMIPERQAAGLSILAMLASGIKVYYRASVSPSKQYLSLGFYLYDADELSSLSADDFLSLDESINLENSGNVGKAFCDSRIISTFRSIME